MTSVLRNTTFRHRVGALHWSEGLKGGERMPKGGWIPIIAAIALLAGAAAFLANGHRGGGIACVVLSLTILGGTGRLGNFR